MKEIYIFRHGQTDYNLIGKIQGQGIDSSINKVGLDQANAFYKYYKHLPFEVGYYSSLQRTKETLSPFLNDGLRAQSFSSINEISWGEWEGKSYNPEIKSVYSEMIYEWSNGNPDYKLNGGESATELLDRLTSFWEIVKESEEKYILVCSHGRAIRGLMTIIFSEAPSQMEKYGHSNTGLFKVNLIDGTPQLILNNDLSHLANVEA